MFLVVLYWYKNVFHKHRDIYNNRLSIIKPKLSQIPKLAQKKTKSIVSQVRRAITQNHLFRDSDRIVVAVSGGSDSLALLCILSRLTSPNNLIAIYVDHGLRPEETELEKTHIKKLCKDLLVQFDYTDVDVRQLQRISKTSLEEAARTLRYASLEKKRDAFHAKYIAVGHNANDQIEEFFLRLFRGTGLKGLSGMAFKRDNIIRPLLFTRKKDIEAFLQENKISWCTDSSNSDESILRNRIRINLLPSLEKKYNPNISNRVSETMDILREDEKLLSKMAIDAYQQISIETYRPALERQRSICTNIGIDLKKFDLEHLAIQRRIIEKCCWKMGAKPSYVQISAVIDLCTKASEHKELHLDSGIRVIAAEGKISFLKRESRERARQATPDLSDYSLVVNNFGDYELKELNNHLRFELSGNNNAVLNPGSHQVDLDKIGFPLIVRGAMPGERFRPFNSSGSKKISRFFNARNIPVKARGSWPIIFFKDKVVAVAGIEIEHAYRVTATTTRVLLISLAELQP